MAFHELAAKCFFLNEISLIPAHDPSVRTSTAAKPKFMGWGSAILGRSEALSIAEEQ